MPIRIKCPKCQTILGVKESLAGRKANCPKCRYMLTIPAPKAAPAAPPPLKTEDAEALALRAFADEPPKEVPLSTKMIEFECPFCSETVKMSADLAGKQAPCPNPECKRIIKVPLLKENKPKDWRQLEKRGPSGALRKDKDEPEGAWSTADKSRVSREALLEADAIPVRKEPVSRATWVRRGIMTGVVLCVTVGVLWAAAAYFSNKRLMGPFNAALAAVGPESKLTPAGQAELQLGIVEFYLRRNDQEKAGEHLKSAYSRFTDNKVDAERDAVLQELMLFVVKTGESASTPLPWDTVKEEVRRALHRVSSVDAQQTALRDVLTALLAAKQDKIAFDLVDEFAPEDAPQMPAENTEDEPKQDVKARGKSISPLVVHRLALLYVKDEKDKAKAIADPDKSGEDPIACLGWTQAHARKGEFPEAFKRAHSAANPLHRLEAFLAIAAIAGKGNDAKTSTEDARDAWKKAKAVPKGNVPVWLTIDLIRACVRNDLVKEARELIDAIPERDKGARAVAQLALVQAQLDTLGTQEAPAKMVDELVPLKDTLGYWTALKRVARHNAALGKRSEAVAMLDGADERSQPFIQIGVSLGMLDAQR
jgi:hypothetical protein